MANKSTVKRVFLISDAAQRMAADAGLRKVMPHQGNPDISYKFALLSTGSLEIEVSAPHGKTRLLLPASAFMAELG